MRDWLALRTRSERLYLAGAAVFAFLVSYYLLVVEPVAQRLDRAQTQLMARETTAEFLEGLIDEAVRMRAKGDGLAGYDGSVSLVSTLDLAAGKAGIRGALRRVTPTSENEAQLQFESVVFDDLLNWIVRLDLEFGIDVERLAVEKQSAGLVNARITVRARRSNP